MNGAHNDWLESVCGIARAAGEGILEIYRQDVEVEYKQDKSPVTIADLNADRLIAAELAELAPGVPVLSEEDAANHPAEERMDWTTYWLVDPLDGTRGFLRKNDFFTVNVALIENHRPVLGVVFAPAMDQLYYAARGEGAFRQDAGAPAQPIHVRESTRDEPVIAVSRMHVNKPTTQLLAQLGRHRLIRADSSLKCCLVADGSADLCLRVGPTCEWDTGASQCIVEEAGGRLTDCSDQALRYNARKSLINPSFVVHTPASPDWRRFTKDL